MTGNKYIIAYLTLEIERASERIAYLDAMDKSEKIYPWSTIHDRYTERRDYLQSLLEQLESRQADLERMVARLEAR